MCIRDRVKEYQRSRAKPGDRVTGASRQPHDEQRGDGQSHRQHWRRYGRVTQRACRADGNGHAEPDEYNETDHHGRLSSDETLPSLAAGPRNFSRLPAVTLVNELIDAW